jgi:hypothetical protein
MARFYASTYGSAKTSATRQGTPASGIESHTRGWNVGVRVKGLPAGPDGKTDRFHVQVTRGSNGGAYGVTVLTITNGNERGRSTVTFTNPTTDEQTTFTV